MLVAKPEYLQQLGGQFLKSRTPLSSAALKTLALITYRQPATAAESCRPEAYRRPGCWIRCWSGG